MAAMRRSNEGNGVAPGPRRETVAPVAVVQPPRRTTRGSAERATTRAVVVVVTAPAPPAPPAAFDGLLLPGESTDDSRLRRPCDTDHRCATARSSCNTTVALCNPVAASSSASSSSPLPPPSPLPSVPRRCVRVRRGGNPSSGPSCLRTRCVKARARSKDAVNCARRLDLKISSKPISLSPCARLRMTGFTRAAVGFNAWTRSWVRRQAPSKCGLRVEWYRGLEPGLRVLLPRTCGARILLGDKAGLP